MLKISHHFSKHCSCHLQGEYVMVGHFWKPYIGQAVGGKLDLMVLIGEAEEPVFTLKMATVMFAEILDNFQHLMWLISKSQSCTNVILPSVLITCTYYSEMRH
jgi:hypothetical protein